MKTTLFRTLSTLAAGLLLGACQVPLTWSPPSSGLGSVHLEVSSGRTVVAGLAADHYDVTLAQTGYTSISKTVSSGSSIDIASVPMGTWTATVVAKTAAPANQTLASGSASLVLTAANQTVNQTVVLNFAQTAAGLGSFRLPVQFNTATGIDFLSAQVRLVSASTWTDLGPLSLTTAGGVSTATIASTSLASGAYQLLLTFRRGGATGPSAGVFGEAVNIWDNVTSDQWMDPADGTLKTIRAFSDAEFFSSNASLAGLTVQSGGAAVALTPGFASGITAYSVLTASPQLTLFATGSVAGQTLEYRIGTGSWTAVTAASGSGEITVNPGTEAVSLRVTAPDRTTQKTYSIAQGLRLNQTALAMVPGFSGPFQLTAGPGTPSVTWSTSNASVASVSAGAVTAVGTGTATITATVNGVSADCSVTVAATVALGTVGPAGGLIYIDQGNNNSGWHYLEAAPADQAEAVRWAPLDTTGTAVATVGTIGQGDGNTTAILAACGTANGTNYAAAIARAYTLGGFTDWYLPTTEEQYALFETPALGTKGSYWSSEALDASNAWWRAKTMTSNKSDTSAFSVLAKVRAVRKAAGLLVPQNVKAYGGNGMVRVTWDPVAGATSYTVYWKTGSTLTPTDSGVTVMPSQTTCPIDLGGKTNGTTYAALVVANFAGYSGDSSAVVTATPTATPPTLTAMIPADGQVSFGWSAYPGATSYSILVGDTWPTVSGTTTSTGTTLASNNSARPLVFLVANTASGSYCGATYNMMSAPGAAANLLTNPEMTGFTGGTPPTGGAGWTFSNAGSGWAAGVWANLGNAWVTSFAVESVTQTVDLTTKGFTATQLATPGTKVVFSFWEGQAYGDLTRHGSYYASLELLASDGTTVLDTVNLGTASARITCDESPAPQTLSYTNTTGKSIARARVTFGGRDGPGWAQCYGAYIMLPVLTASIPPVAVSDNAAVLLTWTQPTQPSSATGYKIYRSTTSGALGTVVATIGSGTTLSYRDTGLTNRTKYYYTVAPVFPSGATAVGVQVPATPLHQEFFIANYGSNTIDINAETTSGSAAWLRVRPTNGAGKPVGVGPANFAVDVTGKYLYVSNATTSAGNYGVMGYLVDLATGDIPGGAVGVGALGIGAEGLAVAAPVSAGGKQFLYATYPGSNLVQGWEITSSGALTAIANYPAGTTPRCLIATSNGKFLYASNMNSSTVSAYAVNADGTLTPVGSYSGNGMNQPYKGCIDPSGNWLYVANYNGANVSQFLINANGTLTPANYYAANTTPTDIEIDSSGLHAYVTAAGSGGNVVQLYNMNPSTGVLTWVANYPCSGYTSAVSIDLTGSYLVVPDGLSTYRYDLFAIDPFAGRLTSVGWQDTAVGAAEALFLRLN